MKTNYDHIIECGIEALADIVINHTCKSCSSCTDCRRDGSSPADCKHGVILWLNQPYVEPDTQERINEDVYKISDACTYFSSDGSCVKCKFVSQYGDADSAYEACPNSVELEQLAILDILRRQRELDAKTMGGAE